MGTDDFVLAQMGTDQARQVLWTSLAVQLYAKAETGIAEYNITLFCERGAATPPLNGGCYLQLFKKINQNS